MTTPAKPKGDGEELVEMEAMDLEEWERDKHTPEAGEKLDELVKQTAAAPPGPPTAARSTQSIARTVTRTPAAGIGVAGAVSRKPGDGNPFDGPTVRNAGAAMPASQKGSQTPPGGAPIGRITPAKTATPPEGTPVVGRNTAARTPALGVGVGSPAAPVARADAAAVVPPRTQTPAVGVGVPARPIGVPPPQTPPPRATGVQPPQTPPPRAAAPPPTPANTRTQALPIVTRPPAPAPPASVVRVPDKAKTQPEETEGWSLPDDEPAKSALAKAAATSAATPAKPAAIVPPRAQSTDPSRIVAPKPKLEALQAENWALDDSAIEDPYAPKDATPAAANVGSVPIVAPAGQVTPTSSAKAPAAKAEPEIDFDSPFAASTTVGTLDEDLPIALAPAASGARPLVDAVSPASSPELDPPTLDPDALRTLDPDTSGDLAVASDDLAVPAATDDSDDDDGDADDLSEFPPAPIVTAPAATGRRNTPAPVHTLAPPMGALPTEPTTAPTSPQRNTPPPMQAVAPPAADPLAQTYVPPSPPRMQAPIPPSTSHPIPTFRPPSQPELFDAEDARSERDQRAIKTDMFAAVKPPGNSKLFLILGGAAVVVVVILFFLLRGDKKPTPVATNDKPVPTKATEVGSDVPMTPPENTGSNDTAGSNTPPETHEPTATNTPPETHEPTTTPPVTHEPTATNTPPETHEPTTTPPVTHEPTNRTPTVHTPTVRTPKPPKGNKITTPTPPTETPSTGDSGAAKNAYADGNKALYAADAAGAITHFKAALAAQPGFAAAHRGLGLAYSLSGNRAQAVTEFKAYLAASPGAKDAAKIQERITALQK